MKVLIAGATGLIGTELVAQCHAAGIDVHYLTTRSNKIENRPNYKGFLWNPEQGTIDAECLHGVNAIINLAGATVSKRWTKSYKKAILDSRIESAAILFKTLRSHSHQVTHYLGASGISIYPHSFDKNYTEESPEQDDSFLGKVTVAWEVAANRFQQLGLKVSMVRTGIVLDTDQGALPQLVKPIKNRVGAPLASGKQWQSWIHIADIAGIYLYLLLQGFEGVYNGVAPQPLTNKALTQKIAAQIGRKIVLPNVPAFVLKLALGEMADLVIDGQKVSADKIKEAGYHFQYPDIESCLKNLL